MRNYIARINVELEPYFFSVTHVPLCRLKSPDKLEETGFTEKVKCLGL